MIVGLDARPALFTRTGFGRVARQTLEALARRPDVDVRGWAVAWRRPHCEAPRAPVLRRRIPARLQALAAPLGFGVETLLGALDIYHHTDLVFAPVRRTPEVLTIHDLLFLRDQGWHGPGFRRRVEPRLRRRAERACAVVVPSERVSLDVLAHGLAPVEKLNVVPHGVDHIQPDRCGGDEQRVTRLLSRAGWSRQPELLVLAPGTREPRKNHGALIDAFLAWLGGGVGVPRSGHGRPDAALLLVGPAGWGCEELERRLASGELAGRVGTVGEVDEADYQALLRAADVVAYPSLAEGFGLPVAEALRCGKAVLTSKDTPMADLGGDAVLAVDPREAGALAGGLGLLLDDPARRRDLGAAAAERVAGHTWDATAARLVDVYRRVVGR